MWFLAERQTLITSLTSTVEGQVQDAMKTIVTNFGGWGSGAVTSPSEEAAHVRPLIRETVVPIRNHKEETAVGI